MHPSRMRVEILIPLLDITHGRGFPCGVMANVLKYEANSNFSCTIMFLFKLKLLV